MPDLGTRLHALTPVELDGGMKLSDQDTAFVFRIATKAAEVRALQKAYFADRGNQEKLEASKAAERELDRLIAEPAQGGLFS